MTAPRPFNSHEIGDLVICRCVRCNVEHTCPHAELTVRADEIAAFVMKHQHTEKAS